MQDNKFKDVEYDKFKGLVLDTFLTNQKLLIELRDRFLLAPVAPPGCVDGWAHYREGQNDVIRQLISIVEEAQNGRIS